MSQTANDTQHLAFVAVDGGTAFLSVGAVFFGSYFLMESFTFLLGEVDRLRSAVLVFLGVALVCYLLCRIPRSAFANRR